jgi:pimeloyl-ACP methyl ester carboxylesterase
VLTFDAPDGTRLAYHRDNEPTLVCLPGGPMLASAYLDLPVPTIRLDLRGTGDSAVPADPASYRVDHQVEDVEALRERLGLERMALATHSAGATLALLYAVRYPRRIGRLVLITPSPRPVGLDVTDADRRVVAELRRGEPWYPRAIAAFERIWAGDPTDDDWAGITPFSYGRWDDAARAAEAQQERLRNPEAAAAYYGPGGFDPAAIRDGLAAVEAPVRLIAGEFDVGLPPARAAEYARLFRHGELVVAPGAGHFPWLDAPDWLAEALR